MTDDGAVQRRTFLKSLPAVAVGVGHGIDGDSIRAGEVATTTTGPDFEQRTKLVPGDGDVGDEFGDSVAIDGDTAVVGAEKDEDPNGTSAGSAYVFVRSSGQWRQQAKLTPNDGDDADYFGNAVEISGDTALINAYGDEDPNGQRSGAVYAFDRNGTTWSQQAKLTPDDGDAGDQFGGLFLALDGNKALIGAHTDEDPNGDGAGSAYVFERSGDNWIQQTKLTPDEGDDGDNFGNAVALDDDTALIGAYQDEDPNGGGSGAAYVFQRGGRQWTQQEKLTPPGGSTGDQFGVDVALAGNTALIGAFKDDNRSGTNAGTAYVFERSGGSWTQETNFTPADENDQFGVAVALADDLALVGANRDEDPNGDRAGSAVLFERRTDQWTRRTTLTPDDGDSGDEFGWDVALTETTAIVGAEDDEDPNGDGAGSAYVFSTLNPGSPLEGAPGQYDENLDGKISIGELGTAAADFAQGQLSIGDLGEVAATFAGN